MMRPKLLLLDCDSTLSAIEGIDELARLRGSQVREQVVALTDRAMNGELPINETFGRRLELIRPDADACCKIAMRYLDRMAPNLVEALEQARAAGWLPVVVSGGFVQVIGPLAQRLGIDRIEAVPLAFNPDGSYAGYDGHYPTTRNGGKAELVRLLRDELQPDKVVMVGDGVSDLETIDDVDLFIGFTGFVRRQAVVDRAKVLMDDFQQLSGLLESL